MAWTAPMTAVANTAFTAAQFNTYVRDNLLETAPAKAATAGGIFVATGANAIAERVISAATVATAETTTSTSYVDLATVGPSVTCTTGAKAIVIIGGGIDQSGSGPSSYMSYAVSGATTLAASDTRGTKSPNAYAQAFSRVTMLTTLTAGSNTFTAKYRVNSGTGNFYDRNIIVIPL